MDSLLLTGILVLGFVVTIVVINRRISAILEKQKPSEEILEFLKITNVRLNDQSKNFNERLDNAARVIGEVQRNLGEMSEIGRGMKDLQEFLRSPKLRGNIGEHILNELLAQMLPKQSFHLQYTFKNGEKVDACIKTSAGLIPIDSKFPMENFRKMNGQGGDTEINRIKKDFENDVKKHIDAISKKYILTDEGTIDYALMYIPSEAVYYEIVNNANLFDYSADKRVLPVSPTTFYAYMRAILMSFEGQKIEEEAKKLFVTLRAIQKDYVKVEENLTTLQRHVNNASNMMNTVFSTFSQLGQKISSTKDLDKKDGETIKKISS